MKLKIFLIILSIGIVGLAVFGYFRAVPGADNQTKDASQIELSPLSYDFGEIEYGKVAEYIFKIKNLGKGTLEITKVATSCACTTAEASKTSVSSGEEVELRVIYNTGAMSGSHAKGAQERIIYVKSNDPINPFAEVKIKAYVTSNSK